MQATPGSLKEDTENLMANDSGQEARFGRQRGIPREASLV